MQTEALASQKLKDELSLAKEIKEENRRLAIDVKEAMVGHMSILLDKMKQDNELQKSILVSEMSLMKKVDEQLQKDLSYHIHNQQTINERMQKNIDFMTQFLWGVGAKSPVPYLEGAPETEEHKKSATVGIFTEPDSSETQAKKDSSMADTGKESTVSDDIAKAKEKEKEKDTSS